MNTEGKKVVMSFNLDRSEVSKEKKSVNDAHKILNLELVVTTQDPGVTTDSFLKSPAQCAVAAASGNTIVDTIRKKY